jgi:hypothetical protein
MHIAIVMTLAGLVWFAIAQRRPGRAIVIRALHPSAAGVSTAAGEDVAARPAPLASVIAQVGRELGFQGPLEPFRPAERARAQARSGGDRASKGSGPRGVRSVRSRPWRTL